MPAIKSKLVLVKIKCQVASYCGTIMILLLFSLVVVSPVVPKVAATPNATASTTTTAESAKEALTPSTGNYDNDDSVGSPKPTKVLSALVAYGDDSDSDIDT